MKSWHQIPCKSKLPMAPKQESFGLKLNPQVFLIEKLQRQKKLKLQKITKNYVHNFKVWENFLKP